MKLDRSICPTCPTPSVRDSGTVMKVGLFDPFGPLFPVAYPSASHTIEAGSPATPMSEAAATLAATVGVGSQIG